MGMSDQSNQKTSADSDGEETPDLDRTDLAMTRPAHRLVDEARGRLDDGEFSYEQLDEMAEAYVAAQGADADLEGFLNWIRTQAH
jgi:hypothetical protein